MNKKGFTLAELLAVIAVLAIVITIAASGVVYIINKSRKSANEEDMASLKEAAIIYVQDNEINNETCIKASTLMAEGLYDDKEEYEQKSVKVSYNSTDHEYDAVVYDKDNCTN